VAEESGELGEGDGFFGGVDDCFDLGFKAHGGWSKVSISTGGGSGCGRQDI
jgi:hypothetical protein